MIKSTWQEEPEKRPSFSDIVHFLQDQNITDTPVDEAEITSVGTKNDGAYLDLSTIVVKQFSIIHIINFVLILLHHFIINI